MSAASNQKCRQWSVSMNTLFARSPHQAASNAAEPMP
jgi:hypothetical protein